jgi:protein CpxP
MKSIRFRLLAAGLAVLIGTAIAHSQTSDEAAPPPPPMHGPGMGMGPHMLKFMTAKLNLTDAQQEQAKGIMQKEMSGMKPMMQQSTQIEQQLHQYAEGNYDEAKVRTLATQKAQLEVEMTVQRTRLHNELYQLLTPDQQSKLKEIEATHQARMHQRMQKHSQDGPPAPPADLN